MDPFSLVIIPMLVTMTTPQFNLTTFAWNSVVQKIKGDPKAINHDLQKAIKIAYLKALIEIAENITKGQIQSFRLHQPGKLQAKIKEWRAEINILPGLEDIAEIKPPVQNTEEIEQLLFSHGELTENIQELESRLVGDALANMADLPAEYQEQVKTGLFQRFYDHFVEELKSNRRAFDAFELYYLTKINQSLEEVKASQLRMQDLFGQALAILQDLRRDTAEILSRLDPQNPQLTDEEWQVMAGLMLAEQRALSSNLFSSADGLQLNNIDVYVPLGLEERKQQQKVKGDFSPEQFAQNSQEQVTLTPISEDQFFQQVLRAGQSPTSQGKRLAIIGEAGAGKTTRLQMIADFILKKKLGLPIWVPLRRLTGGLGDYLQRWLNDATGQSNLLADFQAQFQAGKVWLLLDGLDEMTDRITADHGNLLQGWWSQARFVVTCRVNVWDNYRGAFDQFDVYRNLDFQLDQVQLFINKFFQKVDKSAAGEELWSSLQGENYQRLRDLVRNPLRLFLLCWAWEQGDRNLPETQAGLYEQLVKQLYRWKSDVIPTTEVERRLIQEKLSELALMAINGRDLQGRVIPRFWFRESLLEQVFGAIDNPICQLALRVGLINQLGQTAEAPIERAYGFYHATFQEYFAALGVADWDYFLPRNHVNFPVKDKKYRIFSAQWEQVILLWLGRGDIRDEVKEEFIKKLVSFDDGCGEWNFNSVDRGFYEYRTYFLASMVINEFKNCSLANEIIKQIIKWEFGYFNEEKQHWLTYLHPIANESKVLPIILRDKVITNLIELLESTDIDNIRLQVAKALGKLDVGNEVAIHELIRILEFTDNDNTRLDIAESLGRIDPGNEVAIHELICLLEFTDNHNILLQIASNLKEISLGNELAINKLIDVLKTTDNDNTLLQIAKILSNIAVSNDLAINKLIDVLKTTDNDNTSLQVAKILGNIAVGNEIAIHELSCLLEFTDNDHILCQVAYSLGKIDIGNDLAIKSLIHVLEKTDNDHIRYQAAYSLGKIDIGNDLAIESLIRVLEKTDNDHIRCQAAYSLGKIDIGNDLAIESLIHVLEKTDNNSFLPFNNLGKILIQNKLVIRKLTRILESTDNNDDTCSDIANILVKVVEGNDLAIRMLINILEKSTDNNICWMCAESLSYIAIGDKFTIQYLINILESTDNDHTRRWIAYSLGTIDIGNEVAIYELIRILEITYDNYYDDTCANIANSLVRIAVGNELVIQALIHILESTNNNYYSNQYWIVNTLGKIIATNEQRKKVISLIQKHLNKETYENSGQFQQCYEILWNIAQDLTYVDFYQAWHNNPSPLNLAQLPQLLQAQIANHNLTETHQILLIDGSKFIDQDNPSLDIYEQLLEQQCQPRPNGEPENLSQLKSYWGQIRRNSDKKTILIFYENPTPPIPQGFSPKFINTLSRLEGAIALIDDNIQSDHIKTFTSQDPNLLQNIIDWVKNITA